MSSLQIELLSGVQPVIDNAVSWDDLWSRSPPTSPIARAHPTAAWLNAFAPGRRCETVVIRRGERWLAALPLVETSWGRVVQAAGLPRNDWCEAGDLLVDETDNVKQVTHELARCLSTSKWPLYRFSFVRSSSIAWRGLINAMRLVGMRVDCRRMHEVAQVRIPQHWGQMEAQLSKNYRKQIRRSQRQLQELGELRLRWGIPDSSAELRQLLESALAIENGGWKGTLGTSVVQRPDVHEYLYGLAEELRRERAVAIAFLELDGRAIAFELLWHAKQTFHSYKVGFDEEFRGQQPGNVLLYMLVQDIAQNRRARLFDCVGPVSTGPRRLANVFDPVTRITAAPQRIFGRTLVGLYQTCWPSKGPVSEPSLAQ